MNQITFKDFHLTQNQDDVYSSDCIASTFVRCSPQRQLGLVVPTKAPIACTDGLVGGMIANTITSFLSYSLDRTYCWSGGHVYNLDLDGTPSQTDLHTLAPAAGATGCYNVILFGGKIYYAMEKRLGVLDPATNTFNDNFGTFTNGNSEILHPMRIVDDTLYIGDGDLIAIVDDAGIFTPNALDIESDFQVTALFDWNSQLVIGAESKRNGTSFNEHLHSYSKIYRWNGWSPSFDVSIFVPEEMICGFMVVNGGLFILTKGNKVRIYQYNEPYPVYFSDLPTGTQDVETRRNAEVYPMGIHHYAGGAYFAVGGPLSSTGYTPGIYSLRAKQDGAPLTIQLEQSYRGYEIQEYATFYCLNSLAGFWLMWSYSQVDNPLQDAIGIDYIFTDAAQSCYKTFSFKTGVFRGARKDQKLCRLVVPVSIMTVGCSMYAVCHANGPFGNSFGVEMVKDTDRNIFRSRDMIPAANTMQFEVVVEDTTVGAVGCSVEEVTIEFE